MARVYKVHYIVQTSGGAYKIVSATCQGQNEFYCFTGDEVWGICGFEELENVRYFYFKDENKSWWRNREDAEVIRRVLTLKRNLKDLERESKKKYGKRIY